MRTSKLREENKELVEAKKRMQSLTRNNPSNNTQKNYNLNDTDNNNYNNHSTSMSARNSNNNNNNNHNSNQNLNLNRNVNSNPNPNFNRKVNPNPRKQKVSFGNDTILGNNDNQPHYTINYKQAIIQSMRNPNNQVR